MSDFEVHREEGASVVSLPERVDVTNTQGLLNAVRSAMGEGQDHFILDLSATEAIDSTALGAIVSLYKSLRVGEGDLVLAGLRESVQRVFALTRLDRVFTNFESVADAKASTVRAS